MNILRKGFIYGGDYNPEQWLDRPDILEKDIVLMKKARTGARGRPLSFSMAD